MLTGRRLSTHSGSNLANPLPETADGSVASGGAASIGILSLDTRFPRIRGDVGNSETYAFPVRLARVAGATPNLVVHERAEGLVPVFVAAGSELAAAGCRAIVTTCGFLALRQRELSSQLPVPIATSALLQLPQIARMLPANQVAGVLTASERSLTPAHLSAIGADPSTPIVGVAEGGAFSRTFVGNEDALNVDAARSEVLDAAQRLLGRQPNLGAILLECANMGPYAASVQQATGLPVFDMVGLVNWLHHALAQPRY